MKKLLIFLLAVFFCLSVLLYTGCGDKTIVECEDQTDLVTRGGIGITLRTDGVEGDTGIFLGKNPDDILIGAFSESGATHGFISAGSPGYPGLFSIGKINEVNFSQASFSPSLTYNSETGNIGIGTTNPSVCFEVTCAKDIGNSTFVSARLGNGNDHWTYFGDGNSGRIRGSGEGYLYLSSNPDGSGDKNLYLNASSSKIRALDTLQVDKCIRGAGFGLVVNCADFYMTWPDRGSGGRALVHDVGNILAINYFNDFDGGTRIYGQIQASGDLQVDGDITYGSLSARSDIRLKSNIKSLTNSLDQVKRLRGISFNWKEKSNINNVDRCNQHIGLIAQEVEEVIPELVNTAPDGYKSVEYANLVAVLVEAIKEQQVMIDNQKNEIGDLKSEIEDLRNIKIEIENLKNIISSGSI